MTAHRLGRGRCISILGNLTVSPTMPATTTKPYATRSSSAPRGPCAKPRVRPTSTKTGFGTSLNPMASALPHKELSAADNNLDKQTSSVCRCALQSSQAALDPTSSFQDQLPILRSSCSRSWGADCRAPISAVPGKNCSARKLPLA